MCSGWRPVLSRCSCDFQASSELTAGQIQKLSSGSRCFGCCSFGVGHALILPLEALHAASAVHQLLLAGEKRVAVRANLKVQDVPFVSGTGFECAAAGTSDGYFMVGGMNILFHGSPSERCN